MNFVAIKLKEGQPFEHAIQEGLVLTLNSVALASPSTGVVQVLVETGEDDEKEEIVLCSLEWGKFNQFHCNASFSDQDVKISVKGQGEVHICGLMELDPSGLDSDDYDSDELMGMGSDSGSGDEGEHPAFQGTKRIEVMDEDDDDDDDDSDGPKAASAGGAVKALPAPAAKPAQGGKPGGQQGGKPQHQQGGKPGGQQGGKPGGQPQQKSPGGQPQQKSPGQQQQGKPGGAPKPAGQGPKPAGGAPGGGAPGAPGAGKKKNKNKNKGNKGGQPPEKKAKPE